MLTAADTLQDVLWFSLAQIDPWLMGTRLRDAACAETFKHICYEVPSSIQLSAIASSSAIALSGQAALTCLAIRKPWC